MVYKKWNVYEKEMRWKFDVPEKKKKKKKKKKRK